MAHVEVISVRDAVRAEEFGGSGLKEDLQARIGVAGVGAQEAARFDPVAGQRPAAVAFELLEVRSNGSPSTELGLPPVPVPDPPGKSSREPPAPPRNGLREFKPPRVAKTWSKTLSRLAMA